MERVYSDPINYYFHTKEAVYRSITLSEIVNTKITKRAELTECLFFCKVPDDLKGNEEYDVHRIDSEHYAITDVNTGYKIQIRPRNNL